MSHNEYDVSRNPDGWMISLPANYFMSWMNQLKELCRIKEVEDKKIQFHLSPTAVSMVEKIDKKEQLLYSKNALDSVCSTETDVICPLVMLIAIESKP